MEHSQLLNMRTTFYFLFTIIFALSSCTGVAQEATKVDSTANASYIKLSPLEFKEALTKDNTPQIIDVRTPKEFTNGSITGAINYNILDGSLQKQISKLDKDKTIYVFCAVGGRSGKASKLLLDQGFKKVVDLKGGYNAWTVKQ